MHIEREEERPFRKSLSVNPLASGLHLWLLFLLQFPEGEEHLGQEVSGNLRYKCFTNQTVEHKVELDTE